ncbi:hypothetical protein [Enterobacter hormaechei]|uniref:hypothetical protein n=1 Tax=Enterobacter hormaechei TaxID=158836 RepID=UPI0007B37C9E|nr:hypothetical protein [Enterobacter hormaechei]KZP84549.1 hypothetical protein A3N47_10140 [Enterobacter hormaechei subsp. xiangfangensis]RTM57082.1 hypothetical protein EKO17_24530 [Enterobacter hormaechei subsp. xiangfangensis]
MLNEIDALLDVGPQGVIVHEGDEAALVERLDEWLCTPRGTIYGYPAWGHNLARFKHEPTDTATAVQIENDIITSLGDDIPALTISKIFCTPVPSEIDRYDIAITLGSGTIIKRDITL